MGGGGAGRAGRDRRTGVSFRFCEIKRAFPCARGFLLHLVGRSMVFWPSSLAVRAWGKGWPAALRANDRIVSLSYQKALLSCLFWAHFYTLRWHERAHQPGHVKPVFFFSPSLFPLQQKKQKKLQPYVQHDTRLRFRKILNAAQPLPTARLGLLTLLRGQTFL